MYWESVLSAFLGRWAGLPGEQGMLGCLALLCQRYHGIPDVLLGYLLLDKFPRRM